MTTTTRRRKLRQPTEVTVTRLDLTPVAEALDRQLAELKVTDPAKWSDVDALTVNLQWAAAIGADGRVYVLCNEGVGREVTDDDPYPLDIYTEQRNEDGTVTSFGIIPVGSVDLTATQAQELATGEEVNLAEFIRTFGDRLDANYATWKGVLEKR